MQKRTQQAMNFFIQRGWKPHQAAGIVGNLMAESNLNPVVKPGDNGTAFGIAQWRGDRYANLQRFAKGRGKDWRDFETQLAFVDHELNTNEKSAGNRIRQAANVQAANDGMITFERPFGSNKGVRFADNYKGRLNFSNQALKWGFDAPASPSSNSTQPSLTPQFPITTTPHQIISRKAPLTFEERLEREQATIKPYDNFFQEIGEAFSQTWGGNLIRHFSGGQIDPYWVPDEAELTKLYATSPQTYHTMIDSATSQEDLMSIAKYISEDTLRTQRLQAGGWSGIGAQLTAGVLDPVGWAAGLGAGKVAQIGGVVYRIAASAALGAASNAAFDYGSQQLFNDPHANPAMAALFGGAFGTLGGVMMRNPATKDLTLEVQKIGQKAAQPSPAASTASLGDVIEPATVNGSLSATAPEPLQVAADPLFDKKLYPLLDDIGQDSVARGFGKGYRIDIAGQMSTSDNPFVRLTGQHLVSDSAGMKSVDGVKPVTPDSVTDIFTANYRVSLASYDREYAPALAAWRKEQGISKWSVEGHTTSQAHFNTAIADYIDNPALRGDANPHVARAAEAQIKAYAEQGNKLKAAGLTNTLTDTTYRPLVPNAHKLAEFDTQFEPSVIHKALERSIRAKLPDLDRKMVQTMAKGYYRVLRQSGYGVEMQVERNLVMGNRDGFILAALDMFGQGHKVTKEELGKLYNSLTQHTNRRTMLDYDLTHLIRDRQGRAIQFKVKDLFSKDADLTFRQYLHRTHGAIALATKPLTHPDTGKVIMKGIKTAEDLDKLKNLLRESYRDSGELLHKWQKELRNQLHNIDFIYKKLLAIPFDYNQTQFAELARRARAVEFIRLMSNMGFNQVQEFARVFALVGARAALTQMPTLFSLTKSVASADKKQRAHLSREVESAFGLGTSHLVHQDSLRLDFDRIGAPLGSPLGNKLDKWLDAGQRITSNLTLFRHTHAIQQSWATNVIMQSLADMAHRLKRPDGSYNFNKAKGKDVARMATFGMDRQELTKLFNNLLTHGTYKGNRLQALNLNHWQPETISKLRIFTSRYIDNIILNNDIGSMSKWMSKPLAGIMLQFRTFVIGAWTKATLYGINHWDSRQFALIMAELVGGMATFLTARSPMLLTEEGREKYSEILSNPASLLAKGWARSASASILPMVLDTALGFTPAQFRFDARASGQATDGIFGNPLVGHMGQIAGAAKGLSKAALNLELPTQSTLRQTVQSLTPFSNWIGFTAILNGLISPFPTKQEKGKQKAISPSRYVFPN